MWVTIVLRNFKTNLKPHKYLCKQYNHSTLNKFCKRGFPQKDLVWRRKHIFIVFQNNATSATWCYSYNPHTFFILKSIHFICTIDCDHCRRETFTAVHRCSTVNPKILRCFVPKCNMLRVMLFGWNIIGPKSGSVNILTNIMSVL